MGGNRRLPSYQELLRRTDAPPGSSWGLFGADDELGTINLLTPERAREAAGYVRTGERFNLDMRLDAFTPPLIPTRRPVRHNMFQSNPHHRDEYLDGLYTQVSSQLDGLRHIGHPDHGFYNGADPDRLVAGDPLLGIQRCADHGIVGRGVLVDVGRYLNGRGERIDYRANQPIPIEVVDAAARAQGVEFREGDILLLRLGWVDFYLNEVDPGSGRSWSRTSTARASPSPRTPSPGCGTTASRSSPPTTSPSRRGQGLATLLSSPRWRSAASTRKTATPGCCTG